MSDRGVEQIIERAKEKLTSAKTEWEHRVTELRMIRLIALEQLLFEYTAAELRKLAPAFNTALADLRSTVTREACVTGNFYFFKLSLRFYFRWKSNFLKIFSVACLAKNSAPAPYASLVNLIIPSLIKLIPNSAKIMSSSAVACLSIILRDCHNYKLIGHFTEQLKQSKSVIVRRNCIILVALLLR